jgi:hypothetical protein
VIRWQRRPAGIENVGIPGGRPWAPMLLDPDVYQIADFFFCEILFGPVKLNGQ